MPFCEERLPASVARSALEAKGFGSSTGRPDCEWICCWISSRQPDARVNTLSGEACLDDASRPAQLLRQVLAVAVLGFDAGTAAGGGHDQQEVAIVGLAKPGQRRDPALGAG